MSQAGARERARARVLALVGVGLAIVTALLLARAPQAPARIVIFHTNDLHGQVRPLPPRGDLPRGGYAALVARLRHERDAAQRSGAAVLTLDGGDIFTGTPEGDLTDGRLIVDLMALARIDAMTIGNHEFDHGVKVAQDLAVRATFPVLGANVKDQATGAQASWLRPSVRRDIAGMDVCVIGLLTHDLKQVTTKRASEGVDVEPEEVAVEREIRRNADARLFVLLTHVGVGEDERLARRFRGRLAAIVGGHSHTPIERPRRVPEGLGGVLVVQAGSQGRWIGRAELEVERESGRVEKAEGRLIPVRPEDGEAEDVSRALEEGSREVARIMDVKVGELAFPLRRVRGGRSSGLGNLICDVMREHAGADVAITNKTGIRADLEAGTVQLRHLHQVSPFGNTVVCMTLSGEELQALIEHSLRPRAMLEVSGLTVRYDSKRPAGKRVIEVLVGGKPLEPGRSYRVATNSFLAEGGDDHVVFRRGRERTDDGTTVLELTRRAFDGRKVAPGSPEARLDDQAGGRDE